MSAFNNIPDPEWRRRVKYLIDKYYARSKMDTAQDITEMFALYNDHFSPRESGRSCHSCRDRVWRRLKQWAEKDLQSQREKEEKEKPEDGK